MERIFERHLILPDGRTHRLSDKELGKLTSISIGVSLVLEELERQNVHAALDRASVRLRGWPK